MISDELKKIYSNYEDSRMFYDSIELYHPNFVQPYRYLIRANEDMELEANGALQTFTAYPFNIVPPEQGSDQQDISIIIDNVSPDVISEIELAAVDAATPIKMTYRVYMEGNTESQITPIILYLTNITADMQTINAIATRSDLYNRRFPFGGTAYYDQRFTGLFL